MTRPLALIAALSLSAAAGHAAAAPAAPIEITSPASGESVPVKTWIRGTAEAGVDQVWVIVHPPQAEACWIDGPALVRRNGAWRVKTQFAIPVTTAPKEPYEIRAISRPRAAITPGVTDCGVEAKQVSEAAYVTRK